MYLDKTVDIEINETTSILQYVTVLFPLLSLTIWQIYLPGRLSLIPLALAAISSFLVFISTIKKGKQAVYCSDCIAGLIFPGILMFIIRMNPNQIETFFQGLSRGSSFLFMVQLLMTILLCTQLLALLLSVVRVAKNRSKLHLAKKNNSAILICLLLCITILLAYIIRYQNSWFRWDSINYYRGMSWIDPIDIFKARSDGLVVAGHPAYAYALLVLVLDAVPTIDLFQALYLSNGVTLLATFVLAYLIYLSVVSIKRKWLYPLAALFTCFSTYILGSITQENPEHLGLVAIMLLIWSLHSRRYCWSLIACWICCYTRETLTPVVAASHSNSFYISTIRK